MLDREDLIKKVKNYNKFLNPESLSKAYTFALNAHKDQKRDSGDPYLSHPVAVANILTELKLDSATIATGLLHDTIEDTKTKYKAVKKEFGREVADLVDGVTKISELEGKVIENSKAENIRKLISRNFVLFPLREIAPSWKHPNTEEIVGTLIQNLPVADRKSILKVEKN